MARPTTRSQIEELLRATPFGLPLATVRAAYPGPATDRAILDAILDGTVLFDEGERVPFIYLSEPSR